MDRPIVTIPRTILREVKHDWFVDWRGQFTGTTLAGQTKVVYPGYARWKGTVNLFLSQGDYLKWRAIMLVAQGHIGIYRTPMSDPLSFERSKPTVNMTTGKGMTTGKFLESTETVLAASAAALGATSLSVDIPTGGRVPVQGQLMSHGLDWPFGVISADPDETVADRYTLEVSPPLRAAVAAGDEVKHEAIGRFEIADRDFGFPQYDANNAGTFSIAFQEVLTR